MVKSLIDNKVLVKSIPKKNTKFERQKANNANTSKRMLQLSLNDKFNTKEQIN